MGVKSNTLSKFYDPVGFFRKGSSLREGEIPGTSDQSGNGSGSGKDLTPPSVRDDEALSDEDKKKKRIGRAALYLTSPQGDTSSASTASGRVLGN